MNSQPPRFTLAFLRWFCHRDHIDEIEGDLLEMFEQEAKTSPANAKRKFTGRVIRHFRREFIGVGKMRSAYPLDMMFNYLKVARRSLLKHKLYASINMIGLSLGLACFILIAIFIQHELSYDRFYTDPGNIYRVYQRQIGNVFMGTDYFTDTPARLPEVMLNEIPDIQSATSLHFGETLLGIDDNHYYVEGLWADSQYFNVFGLPLVQGNMESALTEKDNIVLTESLAMKVFGTTDVTGQQIMVDGEEPLMVTGVIADLPETSTYKFSFIMNINRFSWYSEDIARAKWNGNNCKTYFRLAPEGSISAIESRFPSIIERHRDPQAYANYPFKDYYYVQPLSDIHLQTKILRDHDVTGNPKLLYLFSVIAVLILAIACVNYMNLAIARSMGRAREVGIRKTAGAIRRQLIIQFLGESILIAILSLAIAIVLVASILPLFGNLLDRKLSLELLADPAAIACLLGLVALTGLVSGSYPALVLSSLKPASVLKGGSGIVRGLALQRGLIVMQYSISIVLIVGSLVVYNQLEYIQNKDVGYNKEHVITIDVRDSKLFHNYEQLRLLWLANPNIISATSSIHLPINMESSTNINDDDDIAENDLNNIYNFRANYDVLEVFGLELIAGRDFSREVKSDLVEGFIINETAARALGWTPEEAVGKTFTYEGTETVIGVVRDFHLHSLHLKIQPLMIMLYPRYATVISIKVRPQDLQATITFLEKTVRDVSAYPFNYSFLDDQFDAMYKYEAKMGDLFALFTAVTVLIASLGLFGLGAFMINQRTKEIGIRKVLGATVQSIVILVSYRYLTLVVISFLIALPVSWLATNQWLLGFAYKTELSWWIFAVAGILSITLAIITVSYQSLKASLTNPVENLRHE